MDTRELSNGVATTGTWAGNVNITKGGGQFRLLAANEGSLVMGPGSARNEKPPIGTQTVSWLNISNTQYKSYIRNRDTGARTLTLPIVSDGATAIDLIRRPLVNSNEHIANDRVYDQRYFGTASIRILLSDDAADILNLPTVTATQPLPLGNLAVTPIPGYDHSTPAALRLNAPFALSGGNAAATEPFRPDRISAPSIHLCSTGFSKSRFNWRRMCGKT